MRSLQEHLMESMANEARGLFKDFNTFVNLCKDIAKKLNCTVDVTNYDDYGFNVVAIETNAFGDVFCSFHYDTATGEIAAWKGEKDEVRIKKIQDIVPTVVKFYEKYGKKRMTPRSARELADFINSQY